MPSLPALGPFAPPGPWLQAATNAGERYLPLVKPYDAAMHLGHMASYREALRHSYGRRVLDLGCGSGYGAFFLASHGAARVTAADPAAEGLAYGATVYRHPRLFYVQADGARLPFASGSFDFVFSSQVIEHVRSPSQFLGEIKRVLSPKGFCLITTPNRQLFSPDGQSENVHHVSEMDVTAYAATARQVFPRVEIRGIPQRCLTVRAGQSVPTSKPNAELRPRDYRVQLHAVEECENLLCFAHVDPAGSFAPTIPAPVEPVADELAPTFWDAAISSWVVMGLFPPDGAAGSVSLRLGQGVTTTFRSPRPGLYRIELDTVGPIDARLRAVLRDEAGALIAAATVGPGEDRLVVAFAAQPNSADREYALMLRLALGPGALRHLLAPARLETRSEGGRTRLALRTFHACLPRPSAAG